MPMPTARVQLVTVCTSVNFPKMSINTLSSPLQRTSNNCRCCLEDKNLRDLCTDYPVDDKSENYGRMLTECFPSNCNAEVLESHLCVSCVSRLKDAFEFRTQLLNLHPLAVAPDIKEEINDQTESEIINISCDLDEEPLKIELTNNPYSPDPIDNDNPINESEDIIHASHQEVENIDLSTETYNIIISNDKVSNLETNVLNQYDQRSDVSDKTQTAKKNRESQNPSSSVKFLNSKTTSRSRKKKSSKIYKKKSQKSVRKETKPEILKSDNNPNYIVIENYKQNFPEAEDIVLLTVEAEPGSETVTYVENDRLFQLPGIENLDSEIKDLIPNVNYLKPQIDPAISDAKDLKHRRISRKTVSKQLKPKENELEPEKNVEVITNENYFSNLSLGSVIPTDEEQEGFILLQVEGTEKKNLVFEHQDKYLKVQSYSETEVVDENVDYLDGDEDFKKWKETVALDGSFNSYMKVEFDYKTKNVDVDHKVDVKETVNDGDTDLDEKDSVNDDKDSDFDVNTAASTESGSDYSDSEHCSDDESDGKPEEDDDYKPTKRRKRGRRRRGRPKKKNSDTKRKEIGKKSTFSTLPSYTEEQVKEAVQAVLSGRWSRTKALRTLKIAYRTFHRKMEEHVGCKIPMRDPLPDSKPFLKALAAILTHTNATPFRGFSSAIYCSYCGRNSSPNSVIKSASELRSHRPLHSRESFEEIIRCVWPVKSHEFIRLEIGDLECTVCSETLTWDELPSHLEQVHKVDISAGERRIVPYNLTEDLCNVTCVLCPETFPTFAKLDQHLNEHFPNHICGECGQPFASKTRLRSHQTIIHGDASNSRCCDLCGKILPSQTRLNIHMHYHMLREKREKVMYQCQHCIEKYDIFTTFKRHHDNNHGQETISCEFCSKPMPQIKYKYHLDERHKDLKDTSKLFIRTILMPKKAHPKAPKDEGLKEECTICNKMFIDVNSHLKRTHSIRPPKETRKHECTICKRKFIDVNQHMQRTHSKHTLENNECDVCGSCFPNPYSLKRHKKDIHVDDGVYFQCEFCQYKFGAESYLVKHQKRKHLMQYMAKREVLGKPYRPAPKKKHEKLIPMVKFPNLGTRQIRISKQLSLAGMPVNCWASRH